MGKQLNRAHKGEAPSMRTVTPEVRQDSRARNLMMNQPVLSEKSAKKVMKGKQLTRYLRSTKLYGKKAKGREYSEKELDLPILNESVNPGAIKKKGKKGKKFVADGDSVLLNRLIKQINDDKDKVAESKLEKARRLEEIRELRKKEIERREQKKKDKLESVKDEIRSKASMARSARRKSSKIRHQIEEGAKNEPVKPKKKSVSFA